MALGSLATAQEDLANSEDAQALVEAQVPVEFLAYLVPSDPVPVLLEPLETSWAIWGVLQDLSALEAWELPVAPGRLVPGQDCH